MGLEKSTPTISPTLCKLDDVHSILNVLSFNIEGFMSNKAYLDMLMKRADIILLQEHWLHSCEKHSLQEYMINFSCHTKCYDDDIVQDPLERRRGQPEWQYVLKINYKILLNPYRMEEIE